jgi:hypothetical protein
MNLLRALAAGASRYVGRGFNHEGEAFAGTLKVHRLVGTTAVLLHYTAALDDGTVVHEESTLLGVGPDAQLTLWPVMSELEAVLPHVEVQSVEDLRSTPVSLRVLSAHGHREDSSSFREEITVELAKDGRLT